MTLPVAKLLTFQRLFPIAYDPEPQIANNGKVDMKREDSASQARLAHKTFGHVPGVGKSIALDLWNLGMRTMDDLKAGDPNLMFETTKALAGGSMDRCILYVYRCAVAFARNPDLAPERCKWWYWKD